MVSARQWALSTWLIAAAVVLGPSAIAVQAPAVLTVDEKSLREYEGVYQWEPNAFVYLQLWKEMSGFDKPALLTAFDESGEVRTLYPTGRDEFFAGPGVAVSTSVQSRVTFQRNRDGQIDALVWQRESGPARTAHRVAIEIRQDVAFANGGIRLAGTLTSPRSSGKRPAVILVHGSGAENRDYVLPLAHFLVRRGIAVLGYDKRGVGASTGDWTTASFEDLAGDAAAAFQYLTTRNDIDATQIGLLGVSQAGWVMPIAAVRELRIAFLISVSGSAIVPADTSLDEARNEMTASGMRPEGIELVLDLMRAQYRYAQTGEGWDEYVAARQRTAARLGGTPPPNFPGTREDPLWKTMRAFYFYDPGPTLRRLQTPTLGVFGELDNNIVADKNKAAWEAALKFARNKDYTLTILPKANHAQWAARIGNNAEMASLNGFVPEYMPTIVDWLAKRLRGFDRRR
jgi:pimeloyl-ACP methyl ester carboxylesterase